MQLVFKSSDTTELFASRELVVQSYRLTYHKIAKVTPNAMLTQMTIQFDDGRPDVVHQIEECPIYDAPEHL